MTIKLRVWKKLKDGSKMERPISGFEEALADIKSPQNINWHSRGLEIFNPVNSTWVEWSSEIGETIFDLDKQRAIYFDLVYFRPKELIHS